MTPQAFAALHAAAFSAMRAWSADEFAVLLGHPQTFAVGSNNSAALIRVVADEAEILTLATAPQLHRQGHGRRILQDGETAAAARGATAIFLEVAENNTAAIALYLAAGYTRVGRRPGYYLPKDGAPVAALVLRKTLRRT